MHEDIDASIQKLIEAYAVHLPKKVKDIVNAWNVYKKNQTKELLEDLILKSHSLCGSSGTYGYKMVSDLSRKLETQFRLIEKYDITSPNISEIDDMLKDLSQLSISVPQETLLHPNTFKIEANNKRII